MTDFIGIAVEGNLLATFVNAFTVVVALDVVTLFAFLISNVGKGSSE